MGMEYRCTVPLSSFVHIFILLSYYAQRSAFWAHTHTPVPSSSSLTTFPSRLVLASNSLLVLLIVWFLLLQLSSSFFVKYYSNLPQLQHQNDEFCRSVFRAAHPFPSMKGSGYDDDDCAM